MPENNQEHEVDTLWRETGATLYDHFAKAGEDFIHHCDDLLAIFKFLDGSDDRAQEDPKSLISELRSVKGSINTKVTEFQDQAQKLRTGG